MHLGFLIFVTYGQVNLWPLYDKSIGEFPTALVWQSIHSVHSQMCPSISWLKIQVIFSTMISATSISGQMTTSEVTNSFWQWLLIGMSYGPQTTCNVLVLFRQIDWYVTYLQLFSGKFMTWAWGQISKLTILGQIACHSLRLEHARKLFLENDLEPLWLFWSIFGAWRLNGWPDVQSNCTLQIVQEMCHRLFFFSAAQAPLVHKLYRGPERKKILLSKIRKIWPLFTSDDLTFDLMLKMTEVVS